MIVAAGFGAMKHFSSYHRLMSAASWSLDAMGLAVFTMIAPFLGDVVMLGPDDTLARRRGRRMFGTGMHHDPLALLLHTLVVLWFAKEGHRLRPPPTHRWYPSKAEPSFRDMLHTLRRASVRQHVLAMAPTGRGSRKLVRLLEHAVAMAA